MSLVTVLEYLKQSWFEEIQILKSTVTGKFNHIYCWLIYHEFIVEPMQILLRRWWNWLVLCSDRPCKKCTFLTSERYLAGARSREFLQPMWAIQKTATVGICPHPYWQLREWKTFSGASLGFTMFELQHRATVGSLNDRFNMRGSSQRRLASLAVAKPLFIRNQTCPEDLGANPALSLVLTGHVTLSPTLIGGDESCRPARHGTGLVEFRVWRRRGSRSSSAALAASTQRPRNLNARKIFFPAWWWSDSLQNDNITKKHIEEENPGWVNWSSGHEPSEQEAGVWLGGGGGRWPAARAQPVRSRPRFSHRPVDQIWRRWQIQSVSNPLWGCLHIGLQKESLVQL